jgi:hypothetical protein
MKRTILNLALTCAVAALAAGNAVAQSGNLLGNPGFESPNFGKITNFADAYPWQNTGLNYTNTGLEDTGAHSGSYRAWEMTGDDGAYQVTSTTLASGDIITLTWWALATWSPDATNPPAQQVGLIRASSQSDVFSATTLMAGTNGALPGAWTQYILNYTATPADAGQYVGAYFITARVYANDQGAFGAHDDFDLIVTPVNGTPTIITQPQSQTSPAGGTNVFTVVAAGATGYQWKAGAVGSGIYTNLSNSGVFSGVTTPTLTISGVSTNNQADYVVVVSNGSSSVTSDPANLTVAAVIYYENFNLPYRKDQSVTRVGWMNDITGNHTGRIFTDNQGFAWTNMAIYSFVGSAGIEAFYGTAATITGGPYPAGSDAPVTNRMAFPGINLQVAQNVSFLVAANGSWAGNITTNSFLVQMNNTDWYVSTNFFVPPYDTTVRNYGLTFTPAAGAWNQVTLSGAGDPAMDYVPVIGAATTSDLTGYITGIGVLCRHGGSSTVNLDSFTVLGALPPVPVPIVTAPPVTRTNYSGTIATFHVSAINTNGGADGLSYQWRSGTAGSGVYANLANGGQFSGVTTATLTISNVSSANYKDYVAVVSNSNGSVTSAPPARLYLVDSMPLLVSGAVNYANNSSSYGYGAYTLEAGNNNVINFAAAFVGNLPMTYQWQFSLTNDGTGVVNLTNANASLYTIRDPQTSQSGYYRLQASNSQGGPTNSAWAQLTVFPATNAFIKWSAAVPISGLTAAQVLGLPGTFLEAESFYGASALSVTLGSAVYAFDNTGTAVSTTSNIRQINNAYSGPSTGDANLDTILDTCIENMGSPTITLNNLTTGLRYSVQLFAINDTAGASRFACYSVEGDSADVSPTFMMGEDVYLVGTFAATNTTQTLVQNNLDGHGYIGAVVVRVLPADLTWQKVGGDLQLNWAYGTLVEAPDLVGPWTTNATTSPYTVTPSGVKRFYRVQYP